jgi:hypothetical protein
MEVFGDSVIRGQDCSGYGEGLGSFMFGAAALELSVSQTWSFILKETLDLIPVQRLEQMRKRLCVRVGEVRQRLQNVNGVVLDAGEFLLEEIQQIA